MFGARSLLISIIYLSCVSLLMVDGYNQKYAYGWYYPQSRLMGTRGHMYVEPGGDGGVTANGGGVTAMASGGSAAVTSPSQIPDNQLTDGQQSSTPAKSEVEALTATEGTTSTATEATTTAQPEVVTEATTTTLPAAVTEATTTAQPEVVIEATTTTLPEAVTEATTTAQPEAVTEAVISNVISGGSGSSSASSGDGILQLLGGSTTTAGPKKPTGNFDKYLDQIIGNLAKALRQGSFDPLKIGRMLQCRNCSLEGLSLIRRSGPANLNYANKSLVIDAHLGLPALYISCFPCVDVILSIPFTGMLEVALWDLQIYGKLSQKFERGASPKLVEYRVEREGELDIKLNGYGLLAPMAEIGFKLIHQRQVSNIIRELVYERIPTFIQEKLKGFNLPIGK